MNIEQIKENLVQKLCYFYINFEYVEIEDYNIKTNTINKIIISISNTIIDITEEDILFIHEILEEFKKEYELNINSICIKY